jgi:hypothetical protein
MKPTASSKRKLGLQLAVMFLLLLAAIALFLPGIFRPEQTLFSNDGPLGRLMAQCHQLPGRFTGCWDDLNGIGFSNGAAPPGISFGLQFLLKPIWFSKLYALISLVILGLGAWCFFVQLRLVPAACILGGLAAALNSCFFSVACWGVAAQAINAGMFFFALAALADPASPRRWIRVILAGMAVGMGVIEGADVGAIFSLYVVAYLVFQAAIGGGGRLPNAVAGLSRVALVALCATLIAAPAVDSLVGTYVNGVTVTRRDEQTQTANWDWATQWSLPVRETTGYLVPGLFGYRMDTPDGGCYWGEIGRDPSVDRYIKNGSQGPPPTGFMRYSGGGFYAGVLVVVLAFWAIAQSLRRSAPLYSLAQRKWLWFWLGSAMVSLLLAFGRFAPFYQLIYELPYFSTIRNPVKFISLASLALIVIFAYGVDGLWRQYLQPSGLKAPPRWPGLKGCWVNAGTTERSWIYGFALGLGVALLAWFEYASSRQGLVDYLQTVQFDDSTAEAVASFSIRQVGWFVLFYVLSTGLIACLFSGAFAGTRAKWGGIALGLLLVADLGRANQPWVVYWNYQEKYASNPIIDRLRDKPYEHRVALLPGERPFDKLSLDQLYNLVWLQQQFPYYNIQSLNIVDMPRMPEDFVAYTKALAAGQENMSLRSFIRFMQLTNTRLLLASADALERLNRRISPASEQFRVAERFDLVPKPGIMEISSPEKLTAAPDENGQYALFEFTGALPRAKLYSNWQISSNDQAALDQLASPAFDPTQLVLVAGGWPAASTIGNLVPNAGTVTITRYKPKDILLKSNAPGPTVLLLNDHFDPHWKVAVDGRPETLLRCNFIMRGVGLAPGAHTVEFKFQPPYKLLYLSLAMTGLGFLILAGGIILNRLRSNAS